MAWSRTSSGEFPLIAYSSTRTHNRQHLQLFDLYMTPLTDEIEAMESARETAVFVITSEEHDNQRN